MDKGSLRSNNPLAPHNPIRIKLSIFQVMTTGFQAFNINNEKAKGESINTYHL
jgi:hypothetical protein